MKTKLTDSMASYNLRSENHAEKQLHDRFQELDHLIRSFNGTKQMKYSHFLATLEELKAIGNLNANLKVNCEEAIRRLQRFVSAQLTTSKYPHITAESQTASVPQPQTPNTQLLAQNGIARSQSENQTYPLQQEITSFSSNSQPTSADTVNSSEDYENIDYPHLIDDDTAQYLINIALTPQPFPAEVVFLTNSMLIKLAEHLHVSLPELSAAIIAAASEEESLLNNMISDIPSD